MVTIALTHVPQEGPLLQHLVSLVAPITIKLSVLTLLSCQYLEWRFNRSVRTVASVLFLIQMVRLV